MIRKTTNPARRAAAEPEPKTRGKKGSHAPRPETKSALLGRLLCQPGGASLDDLVAATGWLPHTTRAALTALRKKGHVITRDKVDGVSRYTFARASGAVRAKPSNKEATR